MAIITHESALKNFYHQVGFAVGHYSEHGFKADQFSNVIIGGLGGSGIGGRIAKNYYTSLSVLPVEVYSDYHLPEYASEKSLLILSSYSGLTEETLAMFDEGLRKKCKMICISSGGELKEKASLHQIKCYEVEGGYQPRMALG